MRSLAECFHNVLRVADTVGAVGITCIDSTVAEEELRALV